MKEKEEPSSLRSESSPGAADDSPTVDLPKAKRAKPEDEELIQSIGSLWNAEARSLGLPKIAGFQPKRLAALRARIRELPTFGFDDPLQGFEAALAKMRITFPARRTRLEGRF